MPAETHRHTDALTSSEVLELLSAVTGIDDVDPDATLQEIGFLGELDVFSFWDAVVEEHAERCIGDPDVTELLDAVTVQELTEAVVRLVEPRPEWRDR